MNPAAHAGRALARVSCEGGTCDQLAASQDVFVEVVLLTVLLVMVVLLVLEMVYQELLKQ